MSKIKNVPTIEIMNAQNALQGNIQHNRAMLDKLTKAKSQLKNYDANNEKVNMLLAKLDKDQKEFNNCVSELDARAQECLGYDLEIIKFDVLTKEIDAQFAEASRIYLEAQEKANKEIEKGVKQLRPEGQA